MTSVIDYIKRGIRTGRLSAGQRVVASELAAHLAVSLGVVREALSQLDGAGLVEVLPNRGAQIKSLSRRDVRHIFELREALEGQAAALAARNIRKPGGAASLRQAFRMADKTARQGDITGYRAANYELHQVILALADNERLQTLASELTIPIYPLQLHMLLEGAELAAAAASHRSIVDAILAGNDEDARREMQAHVRESGVLMGRLVEEPPARLTPASSPRA